MHVAQAARAYRAEGGGPVEIAFASERELTAMLARDRMGVVRLRLAAFHGGHDAQWGGGSQRTERNGPFA